MPHRPIIKVIQQRDFLTSTPDKTVHAVAAHMKRYQMGAVLIVDEASGCLIGICTERDLTFKVLAEGLDPQHTPVAAVMTPNPMTASPYLPFGHALHLMHEGGFRHLPVVDPGGRPIGVVSARDALGLEILHFGAELQQRERLAEVL